MSAANTETVDRHSALRERIANIPAVQTLGFRLLEIGEGRCKATMRRDPACDGIFESFHGGLLMSAADMAACFALLSAIDPDEVVTTTDMNIRFLAPCLSDVTIEATMIKIGRSLCPAQVDLFDAAGKRVAVAQVTYIRLPQMPSR